CACVRVTRGRQPGWTRSRAEIASPAPLFDIDNRFKIDNRLMSFDKLGLSPKILDAIQAAGYTTPTPIQESAIPVALQGRDVLGIAQTGTGKTAGFALPMLQRLETGRARARMPRTLIMEPTRE